MEYENLLDKLYSEVKPIKSSSERFEVPKVQGHVEGNKTIMKNINQICDIIRRDKNHFLKFLSRELASLAVTEEDRVIFNRKLAAQMVNEKIEKYVNEFVICPECKKPDTELIKQGEFMFLHCLACGAKHSVRAKII
ncbi:MAG: translation initiation factor IF-2 subunit beta [archaeon]